MIAAKAKNSEAGTPKKADNASGTRKKRPAIANLAMFSNSCSALFLTRSLNSFLLLSNAVRPAIAERRKSKRKRLS